MYISLMWLHIASELAACKHVAIAGKCSMEKESKRNEHHQPEHARGGFRHFNAVGGGEGSGVGAGGWERGVGGGRFSKSTATPASKPT